MAKTSKHKHTVRIIGGEWRGRRLPVGDLDGLRPTPDRVRETLFNWLSGFVSGARVLDLFAGTGALGLEAASRGAAWVLMLDKQREAAVAIDHCITLLAARRTSVLCSDAMDWLARDASEEPFDLVFLDPPYDAGLQLEALKLLRARGHLAGDARVYVESPAKGDGVVDLPDDWEVLKDKRMGDVVARVIQVNST